MREILASLIHVSFQFYADDPEEYYVPQYLFNFEGYKLVFYYWQTQV